MFVRKRNVSRVGEKYEKSKAAVDIVVKDIKKSFPVITVEKSLFFKMIFVLKLREKAISFSSHSERETNSKYSQSSRTNLSMRNLGNLKS